MYIGYYLYRMRFIFVSCAVVKALHCSSTEITSSARIASRTDNNNINDYVSECHIHNIIMRNNYNKMLLILSLAAVFLHVVAWRTNPQKFIQSHADTFTCALGAFCADNLHSRNINNEVYSLREKLVKSHSLKKDQIVAVARYYDISSKPDRGDIFIIHDKKSSYRRPLMPTHRANIRIIEYSGPTLVVILS